MAKTNNTSSQRPAPLAGREHSGHLEDVSRTIQVAPPRERAPEYEPETALEIAEQRMSTGEPFEMMIGSEMQTVRVINVRKQEGTNGVESVIVAYKSKDGLLKTRRMTERSFETHTDISIADLLDDHQQKQQALVASARPSMKRMFDGANHLLGEAKKFAFGKTEEESKEKQSITEGFPAFGTSEAFNLMSKVAQHLNQESFERLMKANVSAAFEITKGFELDPADLETLQTALTKLETAGSIRMMEMAKAADELTAVRSKRNFDELSRTTTGLSKGELETITTLEKALAEIAEIKVVQTVNE
ncbi:MAG: hypothetical protein WC802_05830 [Patescibacteria group bacterium]|jgi:hypothetical protein